jgi:nifR3 family TIM-barrel protein
MQVGPLHIAPDVVLAPMAAVTDLPFRTVCEELGVGLTITEFLSAEALTMGARKALEKLTASVGGRPFGVQIFGREPDKMAAAALLAVDIGAFLVDINMGCPAKRVVAGACGSALMKEPHLAQEMVRTVRAVVPQRLPVTVKHRSGWDDKHLNGAEFACAMVEAGAAMITVHGRTRAQGFTGKADRGIIKKVRDAVPRHVPVVGNGDVVTVDDYFRMREETGCDAVMIGRGALGNPWLFRDIRDRLQGKPKAPLTPPSPEDRLRVFLRHIELIESHSPPKKLVHELRKAVAWYTKGLRDSASVRERCFNILDPAQVREIASSYLSSLLQEKKSPSTAAETVDKVARQVA